MHYISFIVIQYRFLLGKNSKSCPLAIDFKSYLHSNLQTDLREPMALVIIMNNISELQWEVSILQQNPDMVE